MSDSGRFGVTQETDVILPVSDFGINKTGAEQLVDFARPVLYEMLGRSNRIGRETGAALWVPKDGFKPTVEAIHVSNIEEGYEGSVYTPNTPTLAPFSYTVHTHPSGTLSFSEADFASLSGEILQYPQWAADEMSGLPKRGVFGVLTQRMGEEERGTASIKTVETTPKAHRLSMEEQKEATQVLISSAENAGPFAVDKTVIEPVSDLLSIHTEQFSIPTSVEQLNFRSAVPFGEKISDREFGNAYGSGDLRGVLGGVEYL